MGRRRPAALPGPRLTTIDLPPRADRGRRRRPLRPGWGRDPTRSRCRRIRRPRCAGRHEAIPLHRLRRRSAEGIRGSLNLALCMAITVLSGGGGIRTHVTGVTGQTVFKTVAFNRSATPPERAFSPKRVSLDWSHPGEVAEWLKALAC